MINRAAAPAALALLAAGWVVHAGAAEIDGEIAFNTHCRNCHSFREGDHRLGPALFGIVGAEAGAQKGFNNYSGALQGFTWDEATLDKLIAQPTAVSPNTTMIYPPVDDAAIRKAIIAFLKTKS